MSRAFAPIHSSVSTAPWSHVLGIFAAEGGFMWDDDEVTKRQNQLTVVLNFETLVRQRTLLPSLAGAMRFVVERHQFVPLVEAERRLTEFFAGYEPASVNVVVVLPDDRQFPREAVDAALATLRRITTLSIDVVAGVAEMPADWAGLRSVAHFVETGRSGPHWAAISMYRIFGAVMAPEAVMETDARQIATFLGSALDPAFLVHAEWDPDGDKLSIFRDFESEVAGIDASLVTTLTPHGTPLFARKVLQQWRALCPAGALLAGNVTGGFFEPSWRALDVPQRVVVLCRSGDRKPDDMRYGPARLLAVGGLIAKTKDASDHIQHSSHTVIDRRTRRTSSITLLQSPFLLRPPC
jgi:hypothetical protein